MDDVLIFGKTQDEHDTSLHTALQKIKEAGVTMNREKCEFSKDQLTFLVHIINREGISKDPQKTAAIQKMDKPKTPTELRRCLGMVNQLGKFSPNIAQLSKPLRDLLSQKKSWIWSSFQDEAFEKIKM